MRCGADCNQGLHPRVISTGQAMRQAALLAVLAALLPGYAYAGLGLGGLAPAPATAEVTANIDVPTDLCDSEFCLAAAPAACGGNCILTPLGNTSVVSCLHVSQLSRQLRLRKSGRDRSAVTVSCGPSVCHVDSFCM